MTRDSAFSQPQKQHGLALDRQPGLQLLVTFLSVVFGRVTVIIVVIVIIIF